MEQKLFSHVLFAKRKTTSFGEIMSEQLVKVLLLLPRKKENEKIATEKMQHRKCFRKVWSKPEEREARIRELEAIAGMYPEYKWRIYETVNWRDLRKAYYEFQKRIIDWQRSDKENTMEWLQYYNSEWVSNLMRPESKSNDSLFLIDKDDKDNQDNFEKYLQKIHVDVVDKYETPNGFHYIVKPFDIRDLPKMNVSVDRDGQRLVKVIEKRLN